MAVSSVPSSMPRSHTRFWQWLALAGFLVVLALLLLYDQPFYPRAWIDEGFAVQGAMNLLRYGQYAMRSSDGFRILDQPLIANGPGVVLPIAIAFGLFGIGLSQARLVIAIFALIAAVLYFRIGRRLYGGHAATFGLLLMCGLPMEGFLTYGRQALGNVPGLAYFIAGFALWLTSAASRRYRLALAAGLFFGMAAVTKGQYSLLFPVVVTTAAIDLIYLKTIGLRHFAIVLAGMVACVAAWYAAQFLLVGAANFAAHVDAVRSSSVVTVAALRPSRILSALAYLARSGLALVIVPALVYGAWCCSRRDRAHPGTLLLVVFVTEWMVWYAFLSVGWPRYVFDAAVAGFLLTGKLISDILARCAAWRFWSGAASFRERIITLAGALLALTVFGIASIGFVRQILQVAATPDHSPQEFANYLNAQLDRQSVIESWEWELDILADLNFHHPTNDWVDRLTGALQLGEDVVAQYDPGVYAPHYLIDGPFSKWTHLYSSYLKSGCCEQLARVGEYDLYAVKQPSVTPVTPGQTLNGNPLTLDSGGALLSWIQPQDVAYGRVVELAWSGLKRVPAQDNGLKTYLSYATFEPTDMRGAGGPHNPAGLNAMLSDSALQSYAYLGDPSVLAVAREVLDYQLAHGLTPDNWHWAHVPYASAARGDTEYRGVDDSWCSGCGIGDGIGVIEPDKIGELGYAYLRFWEASGHIAYRDMAMNCANALATHVRGGDATHSPWPFRVNALTDQAREEYTAHVLGPVMLFDELIRLQLGDGARYQVARKLAWDWMMTYPMQNNAWTQYFEDVPIKSDPLENLNQYVPLRTASYLMRHPESDADLRQHVPGLLDWVEKHFADVQHGALAISEQNGDRNKMGSHTSRYAAVAAEWFEASGDTTWKQKAFRSFNWASYMAHSDGIISVGIDGADGWWFSDGYGDYIRHFIAGMGAVPEWAPPGETHLLRSTSVVQTVSYASDSVRYRTFDREGTEVLRLAFAPGAVLVGGERLAQREDLSEDGYTVQPLGGDFVVRLRHTTSGDIVFTAAAS